FVRTPCVHGAFVVVRRIVEDRELLRPIMAERLELLSENFDGLRNDELVAARPPIVRHYSDRIWMFVNPYNGECSTESASIKTGLPPGGGGSMGPSVPPRRLK